METPQKLIDLVWFANWQGLAMIFAGQENPSFSEARKYKYISK